jgi:hypothetical protein
MSTLHRSVLALLAALVTLPAAAAEVPAEQQGRPAGAPDLAQVWKLPAGIWTLKTTDGKTPPLNAKGKALYDKRVAARAAGKPIDDGTAICLPHGMPRLMLSPYPFRIIQKPKFVAFVHELTHMYRVIYLNEKNKDVEELDPYYMGYPVARYDGQSLVVTSNGYNDKTTLDRSGLPNSEGLQLTEQYHVINGGKQLEAVFTINDAAYYTKPWSARVVYDKGDPATTFDEYVCTDKNPEASMK